MLAALDDEALGAEVASRLRAEDAAVLRARLADVLEAPGRPDRSRHARILAGASTRARARGPAGDGRARASPRTASPRTPPPPRARGAQGERPDGGKLPREGKSASNATAPVSRCMLSDRTSRQRNPTWPRRYRATPPTSAAAGTVASGSSTCSSVFLRPRAASTIPATIGSGAGVGVARQLVLLASRGRLARRRSASQRDHVEVEPPEGGGDGGCRGCRDDDARVDDGVRAHADRDDRLAEGDDHDQPVALGEVGGLELPALRPEQERRAHVEDEREGPDRALDLAVGERRAGEQRDADRRARREPRDGPPELRLVPARDHEEPDVGDPDDAVAHASANASSPNASGTQSAATRNAVIAAKIAIRTAPSSGSTTLVSHA